MKKIRLILVNILAIYLLFIHVSYADSLSSVTAECVYSASLFYDVPLALIISIMAVEGGTVGEFSTNANGTRDNGPMQVNSIWVPEFENRGITENTLRDNGCVNVFAGAYILKKELMATDDFWLGVGNYHSKTPEFNKRYQQLIAEKLLSINTYSKVLDKANDFKKGGN